MNESEKFQMDVEMNSSVFNHELHRYPFCLVWTPIPLLTWLFPFVGHLGIATSNGVIRDFAGRGKFILF